MAMPPHKDDTGKPDDFPRELEEQAQSWSRNAARYYELFLDPFREGVTNPILAALDRIPDPATRTAADLGCGTGPMLPHLVERFGKVYALDFAAGMIKQAKQRLKRSQLARVTFLQRPMADIAEFTNQWDIIVSINAIVMPAIPEVERSLRAIHNALHPEGQFFGVLPAMDAIHYHTMLLYDLALSKGMTQQESERYAIFHGEHHYYDFAFGRFQFQGLRQKFWQPFEIEHYFRKAGFHDIQLQKLHYPWDDQLVAYQELSQYPNSWDWGITARKSPNADQPRGSGQNLDKH